MKRKPTQRQLWMLSLALALLALLPLLVVLQYHWLGQGSEGERERKKSVLTTMVRQFCHEFDGELTALYLYFQPAPTPFDVAPDQAQDDFAARYRRWRETAARPKLIKEVYQTQSGKNSGGLSRYNAETGAFEPCEWPGGMSDLRKRLEEERARDELLQEQLRESIRLKVNVRGEAAAQKMVFQLALNYLDEDLPGLVIPIGGPIGGPTSRPISASPGEGTGPIPGPLSYRIIALDADYISRELIPELAGRHFGDSAGEYTTAVTKRGRADHVVCRSDAGGPTPALAGGDVTAGFFKILFEETNRFYFTQLRRADVNAPAQLKPPLNRHRIIIVGAEALKSDKGA